MKRFKLMLAMVSVITLTALVSNALGGWNGYYPTQENEMPGTGWVLDPTYNAGADPIRRVVGESDVVVTAAGIARIDTNNTTTSRWDYSNIGLDSSTGFTVDFRMKDMLGSSLNSGCSFKIIEDNKFSVIIKVLGEVAGDENLTRLELAWADGTSQYTTSIADRWDVNNFHTYRFSVKDDYFALYADDQTTPVLSGATTLADRDANSVSFGDLGSTTNGNADLDYVMWDKTQALFEAPILGGPDRGHKLLLKNGMQFTSFAIPLIFPDETIDMELFEQAGYTTIDINDDSRGLDHYDFMTEHGLPSGDDAIPFKVWVQDKDGNVCSEQYLDELRIIQLKDEAPIDAASLPELAEAVAHLKAKYSGAIIHNNLSPLNSEDINGNPIPMTLQLVQDYMQAVKPDMLNFSEYPFRFEGTGNLENDYEGGSPTALYEHMQLFRTAGLAGHDGTGDNPIPVGMYMQAYATLIPSASENGRLPTESEYRLQQFAGLAFGMKAFDVYKYHTQNGIHQTLFFEDDGVTLKPDFVKYAGMLGEAKNQAKTLVMLVSSDVRMKMGKHGAGVTNDLPDAVSAWDSTADEYLKSVSATNLGSKNGGQEGDVIVGFFKALDASLLGDDWQDDTYFMVVNGLTDATGDAADCRQEIRLDFDFGTSGINQLLRRSRLTGDVETVSLTHDTGSLYYLDLVLDGGTGDLFKYDTGSVFLDNSEPEPTAVHYTFEETAPGTWEVLVEVTGEDTAGLSAYEIWVDGVDPGTVSFAENTLGTATAGFLSSNLLQADIDGNFNAGNYQGSGEDAIEGIGMVAIDADGVVLDAQALLGILSTEAGLTEENFRAIIVGLLDETGDGFIDANGIVPTLEVIEFVAALLPGDANNDGVVSAGDYASVQANFGNTGEPGILGDANGDGVVSAGDYASVQANFGNTSASSAVPEPATVTLLALGFIGLTRRLRTRSRKTF